MNIEIRKSFQKDALKLPSPVRMGEYRVGLIFENYQDLRVFLAGIYCKEDYYGDVF